MLWEKDRAFPWKGPGIPCSEQHWETIIFLHLLEHLNLFCRGPQAPMSSVFPHINHELCPSQITKYKNEKTFPLLGSMVVDTSPPGAEKPFLHLEVLVGRRGVRSLAGVSCLSSDLMQVLCQAARSPGPQIARAEWKVGQFAQSPLL